MKTRDTVLTCRHCQAQFPFTPEQQADYERQGYALPTRCPECQAKRQAKRQASRGADPTTTTPRSKRAVKPEREAGQASVAPMTSSENRVSEAFRAFGLDGRLERAICEAGFETPTPVQAATIPAGLEGHDIIGTAQTGTGKTAAFVLPILQHLLENPSRRPGTRVVVLTPTRELAEQVNAVFKQLGKYTKIKSATVYGGVGMGPQQRALRDGTEIIVACPGRLLDHMDRGNTNFSTVDKLVLDEADRMLDMGFLPPIKRILSKLPSDRHTLLFSATFAPELNQLAADHLKNPQRIAVDLHAPATTVAHALYPCPQHRKTALVLRLLEKTDTQSVLIFIRTKHKASQVAEQIEKAGYSTAALHANKSQSQRQTALKDFRSGRCQIMVATDIAARGLDVESISHVINYDIPDTADTYIHRIGRTGRAERTGHALTLVTREDKGLVYEIEKVLGDTIECVKLEDFDYSIPVSQNAKFKQGSPSPRGQRSAPTSFTSPRKRRGSQLR